MNTINIKALSEQVSKLSSSAGSGLPDVTAADNGKVLGVVEGSWNKMEAPSGGLNYSTTEQNTGLKWIDGRDVFVKTYNVSEVPTAGTDLETDAALIEPIKYEGVITAGGAVRMIPVHSDTNLQNNKFIVVYKYDNKITLQNSYGSAGSDLRLTMYYVKTQSETKKKKNH